MGKKYYVVNFDADYADEFDVKGSKVFYGTIDGFFEEAKNAKYPQECWFGTNEAIYFDSFEQYKNAFEFEECSKEFHDEFKKIIGSCAGTFLTVY